MYNMIVIFLEGLDHETNIHEVFKEVRRYDMRLNLEKFMLGVHVRKFLGLYLTNRGIDVKNKFQVIIDMEPPRLKHGVQRLNY